MIKLKDILFEKSGTYIDNAQNRSLKRVGKKYGAAGKKTIPKIKVPKIDLSKLGIQLDIQKNIDKEKKAKEKYKDNHRASNIQNGIDVIKDNKDLQHFQHDFIHKVDKVDRIDHEDFVRDQFDAQFNKLSIAEKKIYLFLILVSQIDI